MTTSTPAIINLRQAGVCLVIEIADPVPRVLYWGRDLGELDDAALRSLSVASRAAATHNSTDRPRYCSLLPTEAETWSGTPGLEGHLVEGTAYPRPTLAGWDASGDGSMLTIDLADERIGLDIALRLRLTPSGIVAADASVRRSAAADGAVRFVLTGLTLTMPLPERAVDILDFTGKWSRERSPQRSRIGMGTHLRESRRGRPSLDSPFLLMAGTESFGFGRGEVWGVHVGWSGNQRYLVEALPEGAGATHTATIGGGELLLPGEVILRDEETYHTPTVYFAWSPEGVDGISAAFHALLRGRESHPSSPRPLVLNTWEAVYFDHDLDKLLELADLAAKVGVERLVLDDGWFSGRRDATKGLGDWTVDSTVWPAGLRPLVDRVRERGMQFGLWFEPEMVNLSSGIAREHPEWILAPSDRVGASIRHQHVLNLAHPDAWHHVFARIDALVSEYAIDYIKWDHNRELHEAARRDAADRPGVRLQTLALYRMLAALRERHPRLEIESCASGGGRVDLGILQHTDRVWASDCNDPVERQEIQRWTATLLPLELIGAHVGSRESHTTHRVTDLSFRLITALFGHAGIEQDLAILSPAELERYAAWARLYKEVRPLLHSGRFVRADLADGASLFHGVVAESRRQALFSWVRLGTSEPVQAGRIPIPGLDRTCTYRVRVREEAGYPSLQEQEPAWLTRARHQSFEVDGRLLETAGLLMPTLNPQEALLLQFDAV